MKYKFTSRKSYNQSIHIYLISQQMELYSDIFHLYHNDTLFQLVCILLRKDNICQHILHILALNLQDHMRDS